MQTFVPYQDFVKSANALDSKRLGKQRVEALQILNALTGRRIHGNLDSFTIEEFTPKGWRNHPAVKMWQGYEHALTVYGECMCVAWVSRGFNDRCRDKFIIHRRHIPKDLEMPPWVGNKGLHRSHQSNLVRKHPDHYRHEFPGVPNDLPYVWPV